MDDFEGFKTSVDEINADVVEMAREVELEVELEAMTQLLQSYGKTRIEEELLLMDEQGKWFFFLCVMETTSSEDVVKIIEKTTKDLKYYTNLVDKAAVEFEKIDSNCERISTVGKMLSKGIIYGGEIICERKCTLMQQTSLLSYYKKLPQPPQPSATTTTLISQQPSTSRENKNWISHRMPMKYFISHKSLISGGGSMLCWNRNQREVFPLANSVILAVAS
ncbi:tigger transposable element-derived protein 1-like isoform X3 [Manis pentadactyla]|uniref:tigger transposable element-derived protein 1-like isoform X3 n=1 Tax=Manis pentadactyla TaxID=143292 RepID=UPI00255C9479|nr:tigger transposable element-derived protein 1-like isoform X3 [Manis pentadactyla]